MRVRELIVAILLTAVPVGAAPAQSCAGGVCPAPALGGRALPPSATIDPVLARAIVRIRNHTSAGAAIGSGTLVEVGEDYGLVLSCAHVFREGPGRIEVVFNDGQRFEAELFEVDPARDLSALVIARPKGQPISVATTAPSRGEALWSSGYGGDDRLWTNYGQALGYITVQGAPRNSGIELTGRARSGDSGGPILNQRGQLAGVIFGTNGQVVDGTHSVEVCKFIDSFAARLGQHFPRTNPPPKAKPPAVDLSPGGPTASDGKILAELETLRRERSELDKRLDDFGQQLRSESDNARQKDSLIAGLQTRLEETLREMAVRQAPAIENAARDAGSAWLTTLLVSFGLPAGVAGLLAGGAAWFLVRRAKRRLRARLGTAVELPHDPAVLERHHNRYVPYELSLRDRAWAEAHAQVGQKYPGAVPYLKLAEGVKDQLVSGKE